MRKRYPILGSDFALDESSDIKRLLKRYDYTVRELPTCDNVAGSVGYEQGQGCFLTFIRLANTGWRHRRGGLDREHLYLPGSFDYDEIEQQLKQLTDASGTSGTDRRGTDTREGHPVKQR